MYSPSGSQPPATPAANRRSATSFIKAFVSPSKSAHKKSMSCSANDGSNNPLNDFLRRTELPPQLPTLDSTSSSSFADLEPPSAPFLQDEHRKMHKKSLSSLSISSFKAGKSKKGNGDTSYPTSPARRSFDFGGSLLDMVAPNRADPPSPRKQDPPRKPNKAKSAIDMALLRRSYGDKDERPQREVTREDNANEPLSPPSPRIGPTSTPLHRISTNYSQSLLSPTPQSATASESTNAEAIGARASWDDGVRSNIPMTSDVPSRRTASNYQSPTEFQPQFGHNYPLTPPSSSRESSTRHPLKSRPQSEFVPPTPPFSGQPQAASRQSVEYRRSQEKNRSDSFTAGTAASAALAAMSINDMKAKRGALTGLDLEGIDRAFEALLEARGVAGNLRDRMRGVDVKVKQDFIHKQRHYEQSKDKPSTSGSSTGLTSLGIFGKRPKTSGSAEGRPKSKGEDKENASPTKRTRPRSRTFGASKEKDSSGNLNHVSPQKKQKGFDSKNAMPPVTSAALAARGPPSPTLVPSFSSNEWVKWLKEAGRRRNFTPRMFIEEVEGSAQNVEQHMKDVDTAVLHKLRLVLRNEPLRWVEGFLKAGGFDAIWLAVERVLDIEWREEHEDQLFHELLLCLKALCTASLALEKLAEKEAAIFPRLLDLLFDEEKKGPSEFNTRGIIIAILYAHLAGAPPSKRPLRTKRILSYLADQRSSKKQALDFIEVAYVNRPYRRWCKEVVNVTKEVFWIFLHGNNVVPLLPPITRSHSYVERNFPCERPPVPAAPYVGGVEWEASNYLAAHLDLLNACIVSLATCEERNDLRTDLKNSGWEKVMGGALRTCKEKLHAGVHEGLKTWVRAAVEDGWYAGDVRYGPRAETPPSKSNRKAESAPKIDIGLGLEFGEIGGFNGSHQKVRPKSSKEGVWEY